jgi:hypothetical protein
MRIINYANFIADSNFLAFASSAVHANRKSARSLTPAGSVKLQIKSNQSFALLFTKGENSQKRNYITLQNRLHERKCDLVNLP